MNIIFVMITIFLSGCGVATLSQNSLLNRIDDYDYKGCPPLDLNSVSIYKNSSITGVYEGLTTLNDSSFRGPVGANIVIVEIGAGNVFYYMLHTFPIVSNPSSKESCQTGIGYPKNKYHFYAVPYDASIVVGPMESHSIYLSPAEEGLILEGFYGGRVMTLTLISNDVADSVKYLDLKDEASISGAKRI